jgi:hypothetical protein
MTCAEAAFDRSGGSFWNGPDDTGRIGPRKDQIKVIRR